MSKKTLLSQPPVSESLLIAPKHFDDESDFRDRSRKLITTILKIVFVVSVMTMVFWFSISLFIDLPIAKVCYSICAFYTLMCLVAFYLLGKNPHSLYIPVYLISITHIIIMGVVLGAMGTTSGAVSGFFWSPVFVSLAGVSASGIMAISALSLFAIALCIYLQSVNIIVPIIDVAKELPLMNVFLWGLFLFIIAAGLVVFTQRLQKAIRDLSARAETLTEQSERLNKVNTSSANLSHYLSGATAELSSTARQLAGGSQGQLNTITELTNNVEELGGTAEQIARNATSAAQAVEQAVQMSNEVRETSNLVQTTGTQGEAAVDQSLASVKQVLAKFELVGQHLLRLTAQTRNVGNVIDIIDEIADETHLLALNASIEAAGTELTAAGGGEGYRSGSYSTQGARFSVIAQQIRSLAERSREATEEVRQTINEMQGAVASTVLAAEEGKKACSDAHIRSQIAGDVIDKLNTIISTSASRASAILTSITEVKIRYDEISGALDQQRTANQQIIHAVREVAEVSRESVSAVNQIYETISLVNNGIAELNTTLHSGSSWNDRAA